MLEHLLTSSGVYTSDDATYAYANRFKFREKFRHVRSRRDFFPVRVSVWFRLITYIRLTHQVDPAC